VLRGDKNQARASFRWTRLLLLGSSAEGMQDANDCGISRQNANSNGGYHREAENERHEERNQDQPPYPELNVKLPQPAAHLNLAKCGFLNLPALTPAAIDD
jgi:hypothetical protein